MTQTYIGALETISCYLCHATFGLTYDFYMQARADGRKFYCPYCREGQSFIESEVSQLKKELDRERGLRARLIAAHDQTKADLRETELRRRSEKGAKTRIQNLLAHMKSQHPKFQTTDTLSALADKIKDSPDAQ